MREPRPLRQSINRLMQKRGYGRLLANASLAEAWAAALAALELPVAGTRALRISRHTLYVAVDDAARLSQLRQFHVDAIVAELATQHPELAIRQLRLERHAIAEEPDEPWMD